jgi:AraC-like DNA-binding protein
MRLKTSRLIFGQEQIPLPGVIMFGRYQYAEARRGLLPHFHQRAIEICFLERGEQTYRVGGTLYRLRGHDQFFTRPGESHDTANLPQERGILYWIILSLGPGRFLGLEAPLAARLKRELRAMPHRHFRAHPECPRLLGEFFDLLQEHRQRKAAGEALRPLRMQALLLDYLTLTIRASRQGAHGTASPLLRRVLAYVDAHLDEPVRVRRLAEVARLSESRLKIRFKHEIGVPPAEYWLRKKIERAVALLPTRSVTDVAYALGFSSSQYFATVFKRYQLVSPSQHPTRRRRSAAA